MMVNLLLITVKHTGNLSFDDILKIAKQMRERSMAKNMAGTVKEVLGKKATSFLCHTVCQSLSIDLTEPQRKKICPQSQCFKPGTTQNRPVQLLT